MILYENGYVTDEGTLVPSGNSELCELVEEMTGLNSFELKDLAVDALGIGDYLYIDTMGIESATYSNDVLTINTCLTSPQCSDYIQATFTVNCK